MSNRRDTIIGIMGAIIVATAAAAAYYSGEALKEYSIGQEDLTFAFANEVMVSHATMALKEGNSDIAHYLLGEIQNQTGSLNSASDFPTFYENNVLPLYTAASDALGKGDSQLKMSELFVAISAALAGGIVAYSEISRRKEH